MDSRQRRTLTRAIAQAVAHLQSGMSSLQSPTTSAGELKRFSWREPRAYSVALELFATNLLAIGLTMWGIGEYFWAEMFFFGGAALMLLRIIFWSAEFVPKDRR